MESSDKLDTCAARPASVIVEHNEDQPRMAKRKKSVYYNDGEKFARVYIDRERAERFADRQKKSPVVKATRILEVDREGANS
jgi:hypothetical protein